MDLEQCKTWQEVCDWLAEQNPSETTDRRAIERAYMIGLLKNPIDDHDYQHSINGHDRW